MMRLLLAIAIVACGSLIHIVTAQPFTVPSTSKEEWPLPTPPITPRTAHHTISTPSAGQLDPWDATANATTSNCPHHQSGLVQWNNATFWAANGGAVPSHGVDVTVPAGFSMVVTAASVSPGTIYGAITIPATSALVFADENIDFHVRRMLVRGALSIGSESCRVYSNITVTIHGIRGDGNDKGIEATGTLDIHGALMVPTWTRLAAPVMAGNTTIWLQTCVNWQAGQEILVTTTTFKDTRHYNRNEELLLASVECVSVEDANGQQVRLARLGLATAAQFSHYAGAGQYQAEVALLSRNVVVQGDRAESEPVDTTNETCSNSKFDKMPCDGVFLTGHGAHLAVVGPLATGRISSAAFQFMGQTNIEGKYPVHFHLLNTSGVHSYVEDSVVRRSYYRCVVTHGTHGMRVSRNVAYDAIGHCYYLESGIEENNVWEHNLGAHIHSIGAPMTLSAASGSQDGDDKVGHANLTVPADMNASPFYITNLHNIVVGNVAVGGWAGYSMPTLFEVIGEERGMYPGFVPHNRPTLKFDGNVARSSGYWWSSGSCFYVGGVLEYESASSNTLVYNGGRSLSKRRKPLDVNGQNAWNVFNNTKVSLCGRGILDWGVRSEWFGTEFQDLRDHSAHVFGDVWFDDGWVECRTQNSFEDVGSKWMERLYSMNKYKAFRSYDTGNRHIVTNWTVTGCNHESGRVWTLPAGVNLPQYQIAMARSGYDGPQTEANRIAVEWVMPDRFGQYFMSINDTDGTLTGRNVPTVTGPLSANEFWMLDRVNVSSSDLAAGATFTPACEARSDWKYPMWACDSRERRTTSFEIEYAPESGNTAFYDVQAGTLNHWGYPADKGAPFGYDPGLVGVFNHSHTGGWFLSFVRGAPRSVQFTRMQHQRDATLMMAIAYPPGTTFTVRAIVKKFCKPEKGHICNETLAMAASVDEVRYAPGNKFYWDGTYLYVRMVSFGRAQGKRYLGTTTDGWHATDGVSFERSGIVLPDRGNANFVLSIDAHCTPNATDTAMCAGAVTSAPPPACGPGEVQVAVDMCLPAAQAASSASTTDSASMSAASSTSMSTSASTSASASHAGSESMSMGASGSTMSPSASYAGSESMSGSTTSPSASQSGSGSCSKGKGLPGLYWFDGGVWDETCSPALHGSCPPADPARQMEVVGSTGKLLNVTRRLASASDNFGRVCSSA